MKILLFLFFSSLAFGSGESEKQTRVIFKKSESHKFSGLKLKGQLKKPELSYIYQRKGIKSEQIVDIPENFNEEIREDSHGF